MYLWLKLIHVISATFLFGTGAGTAYFMLRAYLHDRKGSGPRSNRILAATLVHAVQADWVFTAGSGVLQLATGLWMALLVDYPLSRGWLLIALVLFCFVLLCWLPAAILQVRMRGMALRAAAEYTALPALYHRYMRIWMILGVPAFSGMLGLFYLMVFKPG